jgi:hypothetical protein
MLIWFPRLKKGLPDLSVKQIDLACQARPPLLGVRIIRPFERSHDLPHDGFPPGPQVLNLVCHSAPPNIEKSGTLTLR